MKDLIDRQWKEPTPLLARVRGAVCVFPPGMDKPIWVPERYVRAVENDGKGSCDEPENDTCHSLDEPPGESQSSGKHCVKPGKEPPCIDQ